MIMIPFLGFFNENELATKKDFESRLHLHHFVMCVSVD